LAARLARLDCVRFRLHCGAGAFERDGGASRPRLPGNARPGVARAGGHARGTVGALCRGEPPCRRMIERVEAAAARSVSRETFEKLKRYVDLLKVENQRQNLISASTLDHIWSRHILD